MSKASKTISILALLLAASLGDAAAAPIDPPRAVVDKVLAGLTKADNGSSDLAYDPCPALCDPAFTAIKRQSDGLGMTPDEDIPYIYNVFCQCEDHDNQIFRLVSDRLVGSSRYEAQIVGSDKGEKAWSLVLAPINGSWKITDIIDETGSVRAGMLAALHDRKHK